MTGREAGSELANPLPVIQEAKHTGVLRYSKHSLEQTIERRISTDHVEDALDCRDVAVLEHYPADGRVPGNMSPSCLVLGWNSDRRPIHVIIAYQAIEVVTVYEPTPPKWVTPTQRGR